MAKTRAIILVSFLLLGVAFAITLPAFQVPDEDLHWETALLRYEKLFDSEWQGCNALTDLPPSFERSRIAFHPREKVKQGLFQNLSDEVAPCKVSPTDVGYGTVWTYPQVLLSRFLLSSEIYTAKGAYIIFFVSRILAGLMIFLLLLRMHRLASTRGDAPVPGVLTLMALACAPIFLQQGFAVSADVVVNAFMISLMTFVLMPGAVRPFDWLVFLVLGLAAAFTKPVIVPLVAVGMVAGMGGQLLEGDGQGETSLKHRLVKILRSRKAILWMLAALAIMVCCISVGLGATNTIEQTSAVDPRRPNSAPATQLSLVMDNPGDAVLLFTQKTIEFSGINILFSPLGWYDTRLDDNVFAWYRLLLIFVFGIDLVSAALRRRREVLWLQGQVTFGRGLGLKTAFSREAFVMLPSLFLVALGIWVAGLLTVLVLYVSWNNPGADKVDGLQLRYFLPQLILCFPLIPRVVGGWRIADVGMGSVGVAAGEDKKTIGNGIKKWTTRLVSLGLSVAVIGYLVNLVVLLQRRYW